MKMAKAFTFLIYLAGLSGSLNFDEASDHDDDAEGDQTPSLSPDTDTNRPTSATSGKNTPVSTPDHQSASYIPISGQLHHTVFIVLRRWRLADHLLLKSI